MAKRILIVDDNGTTIRLLRRLLEAHGYEVLSTESPFAFGQLVASQKPDLALVDVNLPAITGDKLIQIMQAHDSACCCPMVLHSAESPEKVRAMVERCGASGYIPKGLEASEFLEAIEQYLNGSTVLGS